MERVDTRDVAALLAATDTQGNVDPVVFEAQRLILHQRHAGSLDSDGLMRAVHQSPLYGSPDRDRLIHAIDERLDSPAEQQRFRESMGKSYALSEATALAAHAYDHVRDRIIQGDQAASDRMAAMQQWARKMESDPRHGPFMHGVGTPASAVVGRAQSSYGQTKGAMSDAAGAVTGIVDLGQMAWRLGTDDNYRTALVELATTYAGEVRHDPAKPIRDLYLGSKDALEHWQVGLAKAKAEGRDQEYLGHIQGTIGMEVLLAVVPASKAGKFGEVARLLDHAPIRSTEQAAEVLAKAAALQREGGDAARGADAVIRATVRDVRTHGDMAMLLEAAKRTDTVNGLLRSGELTPKNLGDIAKLDAHVFKDAASLGTKDGVTFAEAMHASTRGVNLARLTSRQLGDIGEAIHTYDMVREGYTDIVAIKNRSGHGIDFVGRNPAGQLEFHEVKTSAVGRAAAQKGDPEKFIDSRLQKAIAARGHWSAKNTFPGLDQTALSLQNEVERAGGEVHAKWVQLNLSHTPDSPRLHVEKTIENWVARPTKTPRLGAVEPFVSPTIAHARPREIPDDLRDPGHPGHAAFANALGAVHRMETAHGVAHGRHSERLAAALAVEAERTDLRLDSVRIDRSGECATLVQQPQIYGQSTERIAYISVPDALARSMPDHAAQWLQARSPHYTLATVPERMLGQAQTLSQLSPADQTIFAHIRGQLPATIPDEAVARATLAARDSRIGKVDDIASVILAGDHLHIEGKQLMQSWAHVDLSQPAPPLHATVQQALAVDQQQLQQQQLAQQQFNQTGPQGPVMG